MSDPGLIDRRSIVETGDSATAPTRCVALSTPIITAYERARDSHDGPAANPGRPSSLLGEQEERQKLSGLRGDIQALGTERGARTPSGSRKTSR